MKDYMYSRYTHKLWEILSLSISLWYIHLFLFLHYIVHTWTHSGRKRSHHIKIFSFHNFLFSLRRFNIEEKHCTENFQTNKLSSIEYLLLWRSYSDMHTWTWAKYHQLKGNNIEWYSCMTLMILALNMSTKKGKRKKKSRKTPALQKYMIAWKTLLMAVSHFYNRKFSQAISRRTMRTVSYNFNFKQCLKFCIKLFFEQISLVPSILLIKIKFLQFSSQCNWNVEIISIFVSTFEFVVRHTGFSKKNRFRPQRKMRYRRIFIQKNFVHKRWIRL